MVLAEFASTTQLQENYYAHVDLVSTARDATKVSHLRKHLLTPEYLPTYLPTCPCTQLHTCLRSYQPPYLSTSLFPIILPPCPLPPYIATFLRASLPLPSYLSTSLLPSLPPSLPPYLPPYGPSFLPTHLTTRLPTFIYLSSCLDAFLIEITLFLKRITC